MLVLSLPGLSWDELYRGDTPALDGLLDESAVAALSVRDVLPVTDAGDGYATVSAGTRARGVFADGQVLEPDEDFFGTPAGAVFKRNTGVTARTGLVAFGYPSLVRRNDSLDYGAEVGALGEALRVAGVPRAAIANADGQGLLEGPAFFRTAGNALIDAQGTVPAGAVSDGPPRDLAGGTVRGSLERGLRGSRLRRGLGARRGRPRGGLRSGPSGPLSPGRGPGAP